MRRPDDAHCCNGHDLTAPDAIYVLADGTKACRACRRATWRRWRRRHKLVPLQGGLRTPLVPPPIRGAANG
ncbi:MAG: hypothetical protein WAT39_01950 [Planctomycetota bacterium]